MIIKWHLHYGASSNGKVFSISLFFLAPTQIVFHSSKLHSFIWAFHVPLFLPVMIYSTPSFNIQNHEVYGLWPSPKILNNYKTQHFRNWICFHSWNVVFYSYLEFQTMDESTNPVILNVTNHHHNPLDTTIFRTCKRIPLESTCNLCPFLT
jgi:hypothetical protein